MSKDDFDVIHVLRLIAEFADCADTTEAQVTLAALAYAVSDLADGAPPIEGIARAAQESGLAL